MKLLIAFSLALIANAACSFNSTGNDVIPRGRILHGHDAKPDQFPYIVGISTKHPKSPSTWCGGSLIAKQWILTAAHCLKDFTEVDVLLGATNRMKPEIKITVKPENIFRNEKYNPKTSTNDIGLIKIPPVDFSTSIKAIKLSTKKLSNYVNQEAFISGWGFTTAKESLSNSLQGAVVKLIDNETCRKTYGNTISAFKICANTVNAPATCHGDSGGSLVLKSENTLIGVASLIAKSGCDKGHPSIFTNVVPHLPWIRKIMKEH